MAQFEIKDGVAIIPDRTTEIGELAFWNCTSLESVTIPESVAWICKSTFFYDRNGTYLALTAINVPVGKADFYKQRLPEELHDKIVEIAPEKKTKK